MSNITEEVVVGKDSYNITVGQVRNPIPPKAGLAEDSEGNDSEKPQTEIVAGLENDNLATGVQREMGTIEVDEENITRKEGQARVGVYLDSDGDVSAVAEGKVQKSVGDQGKYEFTTSARLRLSTDSSETEAKVTGGVQYNNPESEKGKWAVDGYYVRVGVGAAGPIESSDELKGGVTAGVTWSNQVTDIYVEASTTWSSNGGHDTDIEAGVKHDVTGPLNIRTPGGNLPLGNLQVQGSVTYDDNGDYKVSVGPSIAIR